MNKIAKFKAVLLAVCLLCCFFVSCSSYGKPIMTLADKTVSVNIYQFLLSRMRDNVETYYENAKNDSYWDTKMSLDGTTFADFWEASVLEQASLYLSAEYLFDRNGLILTEEREEKVDALMDTLVKLKGSKSNLNADLKQYGVNYDTLRSIYITETKIDMLKDHLYGDKGEKISAEDKDGYFEENYVAFGQIFIPSYHYIQVLDKNGDPVYYVDEEYSAIAYDKANGVTKLNEFGKIDKDNDGNEIYYAEDGSIAYDKVKGVLGYVKKDGYKVMEPYDNEIKKELFAKAEKYVNECDGEMDKFLEYCASLGENEIGGVKNGEITYLYTESGYYSLFGETSQYLDTIAKELSGMDEGDCAMVESVYGYHVICKYKLQSGVYDDEKHKDSFLDFYDNLIGQLFEEESKKLESQIKLDTEALGEAPSIKDVPSNSLY